MAESEEKKQQIYLTEREKLILDFIADNIEKDGSILNPVPLIDKQMPALGGKRSRIYDSIRILDRLGVLSWVPTDQTNSRGGKVYKVVLRIEPYVNSEFVVLTDKEITGRRYRESRGTLPKDRPPKAKPNPFTEPKDLFEELDQFDDTLATLEFQLQREQAALTKAQCMLEKKTRAVDTIMAAIEKLTETKKIWKELKGNGK